MPRAPCDVSGASMVMFMTGLVVGLSCGILAVTIYFVCKKQRRMQAPSIVVGVPVVETIGNPDLALGFRNPQTV